MFQLISKFIPSGDQPKAIEKLYHNIVNNNKQNQVLHGVTGSGKTFTMANVITKLQKPTLIIAHNKILAGQLYEEMKELFPHNAVEYFISDYDYYIPESYKPLTDQYIKKEAMLNKKLTAMRHSATISLIERRDVIIVSSVSSIYNLGPADQYYSKRIILEIGQKIPIEQIAKHLIDVQYTRNDIDLSNGKFSIKGDVIDIFTPSAKDSIIRISFFDDIIESIRIIDYITKDKKSNLEKISVYPNDHFIAPHSQIKYCISEMLLEMEDRVEHFRSIGKLLEAQRIEERTRYDAAMLIEQGYCSGMENYSKYLIGDKTNVEVTLFGYFPKDFILFIDESHVTLPQIKGMYFGDKSRKHSLIEYGFRLPSAFENRPLTFEEFNNIRPHTVYVSATPGKMELNIDTDHIVEQIIRPTGLLDPVCEIRKSDNQIEDAIKEITKSVKNNHRILCLTITKKHAEELNKYFLNLNIKSLYMHSETKSLIRLETIKALRDGIVDVLIGINLLREGINIPECGLVLILDADKAGFLRSKDALIQIIGRAARNIDGKVILYANKETLAMKYAIEETNRRRDVQNKHNISNNIIPRSVDKKS